MKQIFIIILLLLLALGTIYAQENLKLLKLKEQDWRSSVIRDPGLSAKCKKLIVKRSNRMKTKQKIQSLIVRNTVLQREIPKKKQSILKELQENLKKLKREKSLNLLRIRVLTENIIKKGCPSIDI